MDATLIATIVRDVVVPEVLVAIKAHHNATGQWPTEAQILAALNADADRVIAVGQAFLARTAPAAGQ
jgi:hypothetical protein